MEVDTAEVDEYDSTGRQLFEKEFQAWQTPNGLLALLWTRWKDINAQRGLIAEGALSGMRNHVSSQLGKEGRRNVEV